MNPKLLALLLTICAGCSELPPQPDPQTTFQDMDVVKTMGDGCKPIQLPESASPLDCGPGGCQLADGRSVVAYERPEAQKLRDRMLALNANSAMAFECAEAIADLEVRRRALIEAGRSTERDLNYCVREQWGDMKALNDERFAHNLDNWLHRLTLVAGAALCVR